MADLSGVFGTIDNALGQATPVPPPAGVTSPDPSAPATSPAAAPTPAAPPSPALNAINAIDTTLAVPPAAAADQTPPDDHEITVRPLSKKPAPVADVPGDVVKGLGAGIETGIVATPGLPGDISRFADFAPAYLIAKGAEKLGLLPPGKTAADLYKDAQALDMSDSSWWKLPQSSDLIKAAEDVAGPIYQPKTVPGDVAKTIGTFLPTAGRNIITGAILPAVASEGAGQLTKGTELEPYARAAGGIVGGAAGMAGVGSGEAVNVAKNALQDYRLPASAEGQQQLAGQRLAAGASDPVALDRALNPGPLQPGQVPDHTILPGSAPTTFQATGDLGLGQMERQARNADPEPFIARDAEQNAARVGTMQSVQQSGAPADVAAQFRQMRDHIDQQSQAQIDALAPAAQDANAALGGQGTAESTGYALRQPLAEARAAAKENENRLWGLVNQDAGVPAEGIAQAAQEVKNSITPSAAPMAGEEARIFDVAAGYPTVQRFGDLKDLRSSITDATADARRAGNTQTVRRLTMLRGALDNALDHGIERQAALEDIAVRRGVMSPADTINARFHDFVRSFFERQQEARLAGNSRGINEVRSGGSPPGARMERTERPVPERPGNGSGDQGASPSAERRADQPQVGGSIAYQAPALGDRSISAQMHAPETRAALGQDVPGTSVRSPPSWHVNGSPAGGAEAETLQTAKRFYGFDGHDLPALVDAVKSDIATDRSRGVAQSAIDQQTAFLDALDGLKGKRLELRPADQFRSFGGPLDARGTGLPVGVVAYHGTPHEFDRFDLGKIGSGEGAQVYGHGLYFAENERVAKGYRDDLSPASQDITIGGKPFDYSSASKFEKRAFDDLYRDDKWKPDLPGAVKNAQDKYASALKNNGPDDLATQNLGKKLNVLRSWEKAGIENTGGSQGHLYQVRIARDPSHFLDWDNPLSALPPQIQSAVLEARFPGNPRRAQQALATPAFMSQTGAELMRDLQGIHRGAAEASGALARSGVAGIRYLDAGSRGAESGTRNYVAFRDGDIQVTHRNGVPLARPVSLPDYLKGEARGSFVKELVDAGMSPASFSPDLKGRADKLMAGGNRLDHGRAFEEAAIAREAKEDVDAVDRGTAQADGGAASGAGQGGTAQRRGSGDSGQGLRQSGQTGGAPGETSTQDNVAAYRAATASTKQRASTFDEGTVGKVLQQAGRGGYVMPDAAVPAAILQEGKASAPVTVRQFLAAGGTPDALADATAYTIRKSAMLGDGTLDPGKVTAWLRRNADAIAEMPPEIAAKFKTAADTQSAVDAMVTKRKEALDSFNKTALARIAGVQNDQEVVRHVSAILGQKDAISQMRTLAQAASKDPAAKDGLRRALAEHMTDQLLSNTEAGTSGVRQLKADAFLNYLRKNAPALREVFSSQELDMFNAVGRDVQRSNRAVAATKGNKSGPGTAQDLLAAPEGSSILTKVLLEAGPAAAGKMAGGWPGAAIGWLGSKVVARGRAAGLEKIDNLVTEALLNPSLARSLLAKVPPKPETGTAQSLGSKFAGIAAKAAIGTYNSEPRQ